MNRLKEIKCECGLNRANRQVGSLDEMMEVADQLTAECDNCRKNFPQAVRAASSRAISRGSKSIQGITGEQLNVPF